MATATPASAWPRRWRPTSSRSASTRRRTPTQDFEESDVHRAGRLEPVHRPSDPLAAGAAQPASPEIVVIDPRKTETAMQATQHVPLKPKSRPGAVLWPRPLLIERGRIDRAFIDAHTTGFEDFAEHVCEFHPQRVAESTGISVGRTRGALPIMIAQRQARFVLVDDGREPRATKASERRRRSSTWR